MLILKRTVRGEEGEKEREREREKKRHSHKQSEGLGGASWVYKKGLK